MATLKEIRTNKGLTQGEISSKTNISIPLLSNYETGAALPPLEDMVVLQNQLGQKIDWEESLTPVKRQKIIQDLTTLTERFPLLTVLNFAQRALRDGMKINNPGSFIRHYAQASGMGEQEPL